MAERMLLVISLSLLVHFRSLIAYCCVRRRGSMNDVHVKDGRRVDEVDGHHVKVGVGVLPNREGRRCYSGL